VTRQEALDLINFEVTRASGKFPSWQTDGIHAASVLAEEAGEVVKEANQMAYEPHKTSLNKIKEEAIQTGAMAVRFLMSLNKYEWKPRGWHKQEDYK